MTAKRAKFLGWGYEGEGLTLDEEAMVLGRYAKRFGLDGFERIAAPTPDQIDLHAPRAEIPAKLKEICSAQDFDRLTHTYGKSFPDYVRIYERISPMRRTWWPLLSPRMTLAMC